MSLSRPRLEKAPRRKKFAFVESMTTPNREVARVLIAPSRVASTLARRESPHTFCERLSMESDDSGKGFTKIYLDRDVWLHDHTDPAITPTSEVVAKHEGEVRARVQRLADALGNASFVVATRHGYVPSKGCHKLSFRPFVQGVCMLYTQIPALLRDFDQDDGFWDTSVYKAAEQLLSGINGVKGIGGDKRVLRPQPGFTDPLLYVAQHVDPDWHALVLPDDGAKGVNNVAVSKSPMHAANTKARGSVRGQGAARAATVADAARADAVVEATAMLPVSARTADPVERLLLLLSKSRWDDRSNWRDIATALKNEFGDAHKDTWKRMSQMSVKYDGKEADKLWATVARDGYDGPVVTMRTVQMWAMQDDPMGFQAYKASTIPPVVLAKYDQEDRGLGEIAGELLCEVVKRVDKSTYYYFDPVLTAWVECDDSRVRLVVSHALEEALADLNAYFSLQLSSARRTSDDPDREIASLEAKRDKVLAMIRYVRTYTGMSRVVQVASPLFSDPKFMQRLDSVPYLLGVKNGVVDLRTGALRARAPEDMICNILDVEYDAEADCSAIDAMVLSAMADDAEMARFLQKLLGYAITGEVCEEIFPVLTGSGRNCKGTITQLLQKLMGEFYKEMNCAVIVDRNVCNIDAERAKLLGGRVALFNELRPGDKLKTNEVQLLSGGDGIPAKPMYKDPITIQPRHLCLLTTNHMPELSEVIPAIVERMLCVHFPVTFTDLAPGESPSLHRRQRDNTLKERLYGNMPGALKWFVDGAVAWYAAKDLKRNAPEKVKAFSRKYFEEQDTVARFISERCRVDAEARTRTSCVLQAFNAWAEDAGAPRASSLSLPQLMRAKGFNTTKARIQGTPVQCYVGLTLVSDLYDSDAEV